MPITAWRIVKERHFDTAFTGTGAAKFGGRWNSRGVSMIYTSATRSLAALEILVHIPPAVPIRFAAVPVTIPDDIIITTPLEKLPAGWNDQPPGIASRQIGDSWISNGESAVMAVPSVIVTGEWNYLLNPAHKDFKKLRIGKPEPFAFDQRLL